jgi:hypothetical protein
VGNSLKSKSQISPAEERKHHRNLSFASLQSSSFTKVSSQDRCISEFLIAMPNEKGLPLSTFWFAEDDAKSSSSDYDDTTISNASSHYPKSNKPNVANRL